MRIVLFLLASGFFFSGAYFILDSCVMISRTISLLKAVPVCWGRLNKVPRTGEEGRGVQQHIFISSQSQRVLVPLGCLPECHRLRGLSSRHFPPVMEAGLPVRAVFRVHRWPPSCCAHRWQPGPHLPVFSRSVSTALICPNSSTTFLTR